MGSTQIAAARRLFFTDAPSTRELVGLEQAFFRSLCLPNGTHKTTASGRLEEVDAALVRFLPTEGRFHVLDVGISSGVTTLELLEALEGKGLTVTGIGVDLRVWSWFGSFLGIDILYDGDGNILQVATPLFARGRPDPSSTSLRSRVLASSIRILEALVVRRWLSRPSNASPLPLVSPRLISRPGFTVVEHDISRPNPEWMRSFDIVRAANLLNRSYFSAPQLSAMARNLASSLRDDGLLVICRTAEADGKNHGSIFRRHASGGRLQLLDRLGEGSEVESIVLDIF